MKFICKSIVLGLLFLLLLPSDGWAKKKKEYTKKIHKEAPLKVGGQLDIKNKLGKIDVHTWDKNEVTIDVIITVKATSEDKAEEIFDKIDFDFKKESDYLKAHTEVEESKKDKWTSWVKVKGYNSYSIDYEVHMPKTANLKLYNKYGNAFIDDMDGNLKAYLKYGNLKIETVKGDIDLTLGYGNTTIEEANDVDVELKYGSLNIEKAENIELQCKYSKLDFDDIGDLELEDSKYNKYRIKKAKNIKGESRYDFFKIEEVDNIDVEGKYTDYKIEKLHHNGDFEVGYGNVKIEALSKGFSSLEFTGKYSKINVDLAEGAGADVDFNGMYSNLDYAQSVISNLTQSLSGSTSGKHFKGRVGSKAGNGKIKIRTNYGGAKIE